MRVEPFTMRTLSLTRSHSATRAWFVAILPFVAKRPSNGAKRPLKMKYENLFYILYVLFIHTIFIIIIVSTYYINFDYFSLFWVLYHVIEGKCHVRLPHDTLASLHNNTFAQHKSIAWRIMCIDGTIKPTRNTRRCLILIDSDSVDIW